MYYDMRKYLQTVWGVDSLDELQYDDYNEAYQYCVRYDWIEERG